mmetsp:Transcript_5337/g.13642  ORF Transcript_5337/g.13642 Transcript_5337/m.13642 type:complete len:402 (-) Transcript_5337:84-1289(-)
MGCGGSKEITPGAPAGGGAVGVKTVEAPSDSQGSARHGGGAAPAKEQPATLTSKYELGKTLGSGSFATARVATSKETGQKVAVKTLMRNHDNFDKDLLEHEIAVMKKLDNEYCIRLIEVMEDSKAVHLVEELATGGELFDRIVEIKHFSEADCAKVIKQVMMGIAHMHSLGACHRDLKPENLLMLSGDKKDDGYMKVKIADFGLSSLRPVQDASMSTVCGTPDYLAPEVIMIAAEGPRSRRRYDAKVDVWAVGVISYTMICGYPPFWSENMAEMLHLIKHGEYTFDGPSWATVTQETKDFVSFLLTTDPKKRPTSEECLKHPFLTSSQLSSSALDNQGHLKQYVESRRTGKIFRLVRVITRMEIQARNMAGSTTNQGEEAAAEAAQDDSRAPNANPPEGGE